MDSTQAVIDEIFDLYERYGQADYIGEPVSQIEHMSQSAQLALEGGYDDEVVLAAFFHDIGHICVQATNEQSMADFGVKSHEKIGADFLRTKGFPERVAKLVENHVQAKRYLTHKFPSYFEQLSEASRKTLEFQGGVMSKQEAEPFEYDTLFDLSILLRKWDEKAKKTHVPLIGMELLKEKCRVVLSHSL
jgi:phosphonate degradation associated HDIG domain protein